MKLVIQGMSLSLTLLLASGVHAQVVLNEIYADPGAGKQEFFELYNINTSNTPASLDEYTVMSYFEEGNKKGFYVLDLPNLFVASKGYFVGASSIPFNYQGTSNSTAANFSWNDPTLPLNYGYLKKWIDNGHSATDGNKNYDEEILPVNFNDFFSHRSGSGASYNAFVYKNGVLVNSFFGGTGGINGMPSFISSMPTFKLEVVTAAGTQTRSLNFNALKNKGIESIEYVTQDIGSDNGYIKTKDGFCGTWVKSSATTFHTPGYNNSTDNNTPDADLVLETHLYNGPTVNDLSFVVYDITSSSSTAFPVELQVYLDNGTIPGVLDMQDEFVEVNSANAVNESSFTTYIPRNQNALIVAKTDAGCIDQIAYVQNPLKELTLLPIQLLSLQGNTNNNEAMLQWSVAQNESGNYFEVQKSEDSKNFIMAGIVFNTTKKGDENYYFKEAINNASYYRLKVLNKDKTISYSKIIIIRNNETKETNSLRLLQNPVTSTVNFTYLSNKETSTSITIYNTSGMPVLSTKNMMHKGVNTVSVPVNQQLPAGTYFLELRNNERSIVRFIKH